MGVLLPLGRGIHQTRIRSCVFRFEFLDRFKISRIGNDFRKFLQLLELIQLRFCFFGDCGAHKLSSFSTERTYAPNEPRTIENALRLWFLLTDNSFKRGDNTIAKRKQRGVVQRPAASRGRRAQNYFRAPTSELE